MVNKGRSQSYQKRRKCTPIRDLCTELPKPASQLTVQQGILQTGLKKRYKSLVNMNWVYQRYSRLMNKRNRIIRCVAITVSNSEIRITTTALINKKAVLSQGTARFRCKFSSIRRVLCRQQTSYCHNVIWQQATSFGSFQCLLSCHVMSWPPAWVW